MGVVVGTNPFLNKALDPIFQFLRMVAPLAWVPIALAALQQNEPAALFVIFITSVWPILINTAEGVRQIPDDYNNVAKVLQLSRKEYYINILFPSALPYIAKFLMTITTLRKCCNFLGKSITSISCFRQRFLISLQD